MITTGKNYNSYSKKRGEGMEEMIYQIGFTTKHEDEWEGLNGKRMYMDYEENLIENYNFMGFAEQLMAVWLGYTEIDID